MKLYNDCPACRASAFRLIRKLAKFDEARLSAIVFETIVIVVDPNISIQISDPFNLFKSQSSNCGRYIRKNIPNQLLCDSA